MINVIFILIILVLVGWVAAQRKRIGELERRVEAVAGEKEELEKIGSGLAEYNRKIQQRKKEQKAKILVMLKERGELTNDAIEKVLKISDASVTRYLDELEKEGKVVQKGNVRGTYYVLA